MIAATILAAALLQPAGDTTWWRTEGAGVVQESDQNVCALFVFQQKYAVSFLWDKTALTGMVFFNEQWNFPPSATRVAVRIGNNWISETANIDWFPATEEKSTLMVPIRYYPIESLLSNANSVSLRHKDADLNISFDKTKMPKLLEAVTTCRKHLR